MNLINKPRPRMHAPKPMARLLTPMVLLRTIIQSYLLFIVLTFVVVVRADLCGSGCNIGLCNCYSPFTSCNQNGGACHIGICEGTCDITALSICLIVGLGLLIILSIAACVFCCWYRQRHVYVQIPDKSGLPLAIPIQNN